MATIIGRDPAPDARGAERPVQHFVFDGVGWDEFLRITDALAERSGLRIAYDGRRLEFMTPSRRHERWKKILARLVETLSVELGIPLESGGSTTLRNEVVSRGLEPDECYWIEHADALVGVDDWQAELHVPPDLALEIDVTHSPVDRLAIYADLCVREVWTFDGQTLRCRVQGAEGDYEEREFSAAFPFLRVAELQPFLLREPPVTETALIQEYLNWLRSRGFPRQGE